MRETDCKNEPPVPTTTINVPITTKNLTTSTTKVPTIINSTAITTNLTTTTTNSLITTTDVITTPNISTTFESAVSSLTRMQLEKKAMDKMSDLIVDAFTGGDVSVPINDIAHIIDNFGANSKFVRPTLVSLTSILPYVSSNPNETAKIKIVEGVDEVLNGFNTFVQSQPELENLDINLTFSSIPETFDLYQGYQSLLGEAEKIKRNPAYAYDFIQDSNIVENFPNLVALSAEALKLARSFQKTSTSKE